MIPRNAPLLAFAVLSFAAAARAAAPAPAARMTGSPADLNRKLDAMTAGQDVALAPDAAVSLLVPPKNALVRLALSDIGKVEKPSKGTMSFVGRHMFSGGSEFILATLPGEVELSTRSAAVVVGAMAGTRELTGLDGRKVTVPVIAARLVGVIHEGGVGPDGALKFLPNSPIAIYEFKAPGKKKAKP